MRIVTWNVHGAREESAVWQVLSDLAPDIALLQEVGAVPDCLAERWSILSRCAIRESGKPQRFSTAVMVKGAILDGIQLSSEYDWLNGELEFLKGNILACKVQPYGCTAFSVVSVHSPAWPVNPERLEGVDVSEVKTKLNKRVWGIDILSAALKHTISAENAWIVGGDFNTSETFDLAWQEKHAIRFGLRSYGNAEMLERMHQLGLTECLRYASNGNITPTFRHSRGTAHHQIDHLFVSNVLHSNVENCVVGDQALIFGKSVSDHLPIIADFRG